MKANVLVVAIGVVALFTSSSYASVTSEKQTVATFKTENGNTVRCLVHPEDVNQFSQIKSGTSVKLMGCPDGSSDCGLIEKRFIEDM
ncbi:Uncharacterised protein (plasmid) [Legionella adelaidensis]|uniref:Secreted protein n=1 Tax=Legionella adelaidensis TaxID=45056 RepID=A0A0W0R431_9GAMM|nr:hypothetical protein [Legionella adelaidensis]KTC65803.1 hypothetical protein Lade_0461 [Legionella adelaidensis]VEH85231.1 Uncharacterised protein [Legionella adelaidensis]